MDNKELTEVKETLTATSENDTMEEAPNPYPDDWFNARCLTLKEKMPDDELVLSMYELGSLCETAFILLTSLIRETKPNVWEKYKEFFDYNEFRLVKFLAHLGSKFDGWDKEF